MLCRAACLLLRDASCVAVNPAVQVCQLQTRTCTAQPVCVAACESQGFNIPSEGLWFWFEGMIDLFFYVDLALNFFTAYEVSNGSVLTGEGHAVQCVQLAATLHME